MVASGEHLTVGLAQWLPAPGAVEENLVTALDLIERLSAECDLIVLPELWPCGYDSASLADDVRRCAEGIDGPLVRELSRVAHGLGVQLVPGSIPEREGDRYFNTTVLIGADGSVLARHRKAHIYGTAERSVFTAGDLLTVCAGTPFGTVGLSICFDGDFPEVARALRVHGARLVVNPSAYDHSAEPWWDRLFPAHALCNQQWWVLVNQAGAHGSIGFFGRSRVLSPAGDVVAEAGRAAPGETPAPEALAVVLRADARAASADPEVLFTQRRPDLGVTTFTAGDAASVPHEAG